MRACPRPGDGVAAGAADLRGDAVAVGVGLLVAVGVVVAGVGVGVGVVDGAGVVADGIGVVGVGFGLAGGEAGCVGVGVVAAGASYWYRLYSFIMAMRLAP